MLGFALVVVLVGALCGVAGFEVGKGSQNGSSHIAASDQRTATSAALGKTAPAARTTTTEHNLSIQLILTGNPQDGVWENPNNGSPCYSQEPVQVVLTNQSGTVLGESGTIEPVGTDGQFVASVYGCSFKLKIANVPTAQQYGLSVNGTTPSYTSFAQMQNYDWAIQLSWGD